MFTRLEQVTPSSYLIPQHIRHGLLLILTLSLLAGQLAAQSDNKIPPLELGKPIERELAGDAAHSYRIALTANQFLHVVVEQKGIDVVVALFAPDGKKLTEVDSPNGAQGPEPVLLIAESTGSYRLEVRSLEKSALYGHYEARIDSLRVVTMQDRARVAAGEAEREAGQIFEKDTPATLRAAIEKLKQAATLWQAAGDRVKEVFVLTGIGKVYADLGEPQQARRYLNTARELARSTNDHDGEALALILLASVHESLGENSTALRLATRALGLVANRNQEIKVIALRLNGQVLRNMGEKQLALDYFNQALRLSVVLQDSAGEAMTLGHLGTIYAEWGEYERALNFFNRALPFTLRLDTRAAQAQALANIAGVHNTLGQRQQALTKLRQALELSRLGTERRVEVSVLNNIGVVHLSAGTHREALRVLHQALHLTRQLGARELEALTLYNLGRAYSAAGRQQQALAHLNQALKLWRVLGELTHEGHTLGAIANAERKQGAFNSAAARIKVALRIVETLRKQIGSLELRAAYFASVQDYYEIYIDALMRLHAQHPARDYAVIAFQESENGRARSLLDLLAESRGDLRRGVEAKVVERERSLRKQLNTKAQLQMKMPSGPHSEQTQTLAKEIESLTTDLQEVEAQIRQTSRHYTALMQPQPLTLQQIQTQVLDEDTLLLEYSLGKERSYMWAVTPTSITSFELPRRDEIEAVARQVYTLLTDTKRWDRDIAGGQRQLTREKAQSPYTPGAAMRLSQMLLGPVASQLGNKRLLVVADGALQYIPFGALPSPARGGRGVRRHAGTMITGKSWRLAYQPLIVEHEIVSLPSASTLAVLRKETKDRKPAEKTVAILADPVFESDDERVRQTVDRPVGVPSDNPPPAKNRELPLGMERAATESGLKGAGLRIPRLPATRDEARQILSLVPAAASNGSFDFEASRQTATSGELSQYQYVHFATHGFLDSVHPELSGIVLSMVDEKGNQQDGFLRAHEIFNLRLPAELVVLSACQTGLGKEVKGEGLVGLTRGFMYAGAPRVVVSLWSVNDKATAELMARFYRGMIRDNLRPAAALRAAQMSLMKEREWESPFYWAAFTIQGEWR